MKQRRALIFFAFTTLILFLAYPVAVAEGVRGGLKLCAVAILPSLFVNAVLSGILVRLLPLGRSMHHRPHPMLFLLGCLCGFPIGAQLCKSAYDNKQKIRPSPEWLAASVNLASPAFVIGAVGLSGFHSQKIGILIYLCETAVALCFFAVVRIEGGSTAVKGGGDSASLGELLFASVESAVRSMLTVCGILCFFSALLSVAAAFPPVRGYLLLPLSVCLEISSGVMQSLRFYPLHPRVAITAAAFCCGFSGICVQMQICAVMKEFGLRLYKLCAYKLLFGLLCAAGTIFLCKIFGCY